MPGYLTEERLQQLLARYELVYHHTNERQHRVYWDGQKPQCTHQAYTDGSETHPISATTTGVIRGTRESASPAVPAAVLNQ